LIRNTEIRKAIKEAHIYSYEVAEALNIHENTLYRMLRKQISEEKKEEIMKIIKKLSVRKIH